jgi:class 3 adenylate cyclase
MHVFLFQNELYKVYCQTKEVQRIESEPYFNNNCYLISDRNIEMPDLTILMIDVKGSSSLWVADPKVMAYELDRLYARVRSSATRGGGTLIKCIGDAFMLTFNDPETAVTFAVRLQMKKDSKLAMRIGIAHGPMFVRNWEIQGCRLWDYFGNTVNTAARVESMVSPVGGFALALCPRDATSAKAVAMKARVVAALTPGKLLPLGSTPMRMVRYSSDEQLYVCTAGLRNSARTVPYSMQRKCRRVSELRGVSAVDVFVADSFVRDG